MLKINNYFSNLTLIFIKKKIEAYNTHYDYISIIRRVLKTVWANRTDYIAGRLVSRRSVRENPLVTFEACKYNSHRSTSTSSLVNGKVA